ncbi:MAG: response regulator transcription factor [Acidimicrobiia bacterium]
MVAVYPAPSPELARALRDSGLKAVEIADAAELDERRPVEGWAVLVVEVGDAPRISSTARRAREEGLAVLAVTSRDRLDQLDGEALDDFILTPVDPAELRLRVQRLAVPREGQAVLRFKDLELNTATYQATVGRRPVDLTYMEYELLCFFVTNPRRVWSREQLLSNVWGYEYFGGARTVDVHVRRLRSKLGEERASWITTVRSVGYRFG